MKLQLANIGKIKKCEIDINGITVIAGENNSGKSTVGKTLYALYHVFHNVNEKIADKRSSFVGNVLWEGFNFSPFLERGNVGDLIPRFMGKEPKEIDHILEGVLIENNYTESDIHRINLTQVSKRIYDVFKIPDEDLMKAIFQRTLMDELGRYIGHVNHPQQGSKISLILKNEEAFNITFKNGKIQNFKHTNLAKDIIYIDDPFTLDYMQDGRYWRIFSSGHKKNLIQKIYAEESQDVVGDYLTAEKLKDIYAKVSTVCHGSLVRDNAKWSYRSDEFKKDLDITSLSTGMKNFVILQTLLEKGAITENGIVVLDEPEVNLHPEWQLVLAELLVLLHIKFELNILLNTHSPYFLEAIEAFSKKYAVADKCKYYLATNKDEWSNIEDVTGKTEKIYKLLAAPFQKLEDLLHE